MIPVFDGLPTRSRPIVTYTLMALCCLAYALDFDKPELQYAAYPVLFFNGSDHWLSLIVYQFLHGDPNHLFFNMLFLFIFGNNVEDILGRGRFILLYLLSGVAAALVHGIAGGGNSYVALIGASGSISGILGAYVLRYPRVRIRVFMLFIVIGVPAWAFVMFWFASQIFGILNNDGNIAWYAHLGGFAAGVFLYFLVGGDRRERKRKKMSERRSSAIPDSE